MAAQVYQFKVDVDTLSAINKLQQVAKEAQKTANENESGAKKASAAWSTFQGVLGGAAVIGAFKAIGSAATGAFGAILESTKTTERIKTELQVMTGSVEAAEAAYANLQNFAATTPFQIEGIADSARQLIAFGFSSETVTDKLRFIGDIASGSGNSLQDLTQIFGQVAAAGQLTGERFNQLAERAVPIGSAIAKTMGVAESSVKDLVSNGKVSFDTFEKAFQSLATEGGIFFDGMNKKSQTLDGVLSTLSDTFDLAASDVGNAFLPAIKEAVTAVSDFILANRELIKAFAQKIGDNFIAFFKDAVEIGTSFIGFVRDNREALTFLGTALGLAAGAWTGYATAVWAANAAQVAFAAVNPIVVGLTLAVAAIAATITWLNEISIAFLNWADNIAAVVEKIPGLSNKAAALREEIARSAAQIQKNIDAKESDILATDKLATANEQAAVRSTEARRQQVADGAQLTKEELKEQQKFNEELAKLQNERQVTEGAYEIYKDVEQERLRSERFAKLEADVGTEEALKFESRMRLLEGEKQTTATIREQERIREEIRTQTAEYGIKRIEEENKAKAKAEEEHQKELKRIREEADKEEKRQREGRLLSFQDSKLQESNWAKKTEIEKLDAVRSGFATMAGVSKDGNKQLGEIGKAASIAGATIDTYKAATGAYASLAGIPIVGPALGAAAAAAAITAGLANVREIGRQRFERGGIVAGSSFTGDNVGVRVNSGELILNRAQQKNLAPQLMGQDNTDVVSAINLLREDVRSLQLVVGDDEVFSAVRRQVQAGRQLS